jgi:hypothetical protein
MNEFLEGRVRGAMVTIRDFAPASEEVDTKYENAAYA